MSEHVVKLYGPPGTGKTTRLTAQALRVVNEYGPDRLCAITFTRTAADELKERIATARGLKPPADGWARRKFFNNILPWVGTIHSLALKMTGGKVMDSDDLKAFVLSLGGTPTRHDMDELEGYTWAEPGRDEVEAALAVHSAARHRMIPIEQAYLVVPWDPRGPVVSVERCEHIAQAYTDFKVQIGRIDFEDMLEAGLFETPPVDVVLADEVQDNSPLLWRAVDAWSVGRLTALAGDPYQAIYLFSGAAPELFINHPGVLRPLGDSRRLTAHAAERAQSILYSAGYRDEEWLGTWTGTGSGEVTDGTEFWLARTARLLRPVYEQLEEAGVPYGNVRGGGPLERKAAHAFRALVQLRQRGAISALAMAGLIDQLSGLPRGLKAESARLARQAPEHMVEAHILGRDLRAEALGLPHGEYYERVLAQHGLQAFVQPPLVRVGTIHAAKGREADTVHLVDSWGTLPYRNLLTPEGARAEACVAYVGTTRHRRLLEFVPGQEGTPYPGF